MYVAIKAEYAEYFPISIGKIGRVIQQGSNWYLVDWDDGREPVHVIKDFVEIIQVKEK